MQNSNLRLDAIAPSYDEQLPEHIREFLLVKKTNLTVASLKNQGLTCGKGVDLGCGTGWHIKSIAAHGYEVTGVEACASLAQQAAFNNRQSQARVQCADMLHLKFDDCSFDFAYCINSLHHLKNNEELMKALGEIRRILKGNGVCIIHELNTYFLFRLYMSYIFPLINSIDKFGGENWVSPKVFARQNLFEVKELRYYTFFPHIIPKSLFGFSLKVNSVLERSFLSRFGAHYMVVLKK